MALTLDPDLRDPRDLLPHLPKIYLLHTNWSKLSGGGGYHSFRINGRGRMDVETFFGETRGSVINLTSRELRDLDSGKVQTTAWIQFKAEVEDGDGNVIGVDIVAKAFNSQMMEVLKGSDLNEIFEGHMETQVENPAWQTADSCLIESCF